MAKYDLPIETGAPDPAQAVKALENTGVYLFRYFPKLKMAVLTERICADLGLEPVYRDMPESLFGALVRPEDKSAFTGAFGEISDGASSACADFTAKDRSTLFRLTLAAEETDGDNLPEVCVGVLENRTDVKSREHELLVQSERRNAELTGHLEIILEEISGGFKISRLDEHYSPVFASKSLARLFGYTMEEFLEQSAIGPSALAHGDDVAVTEADMKRQLSVNGHYTTKYRIKRKDGSYRWIVETGREVHDDAYGDVIYSLFQDIDSAERSQKELENVISSISCGVLRHRASDNKLIMANKAALEILGYSSVEEMESDGFDGTAGSVVEGDRDELRRVIADVSENGGSRTVEYRAKRGNGAEKYCYGTVCSFTDPDGNRIIQRSIMDITDRKLKEEAEQTNADLMQRLDTAMNGIKGGFRISRNDKGYTLLYISEGAAAIQGYSVEELTAMYGSVSECIYADDIESVKSSVVDQSNIGDTYSAKYRVRHRDGSLRWIHDSGKKVKDKDGGELFYSLIQDITEVEERAIKLRDTLTMQTQMVEALSCGVFAYTLPDHDAILVNDEVKRLFGYPADKEFDYDAMMGAKIVPEDFAQIRDAVRTLTDVGCTCRYKFRTKSPCGEVTIISTVTKLLRFEDGQRFILSVLQDVTRQQRLNEMLVTEQKRYRDALMSDAEHSYCFDVTKGLIVQDYVAYNTDSAAAELGLTVPYSYDEMIKRWKAKFQPEFLNKKTAELLSCAGFIDQFERNNRSFSVEYFIPFDDTYHRMTVLLSRDSMTEHITAIVFTNDITETVREETRRRNELAAANRTLHSQMEITQSFSSVFFASWKIDPEQDAVEEISVPDWAHHIMKRSKGSWSKAKEILLEQFVTPPFKKKMTEFLENSLNGRTSCTQMLTCEYIGTKSGWCSASFIPVKRGREYIYAVRVIENEKRQELERNAIIEALGNIYSAIYSIDLVSGEIEDMGCPDDIREALKAYTKAEDMLSFWVYNYVQETQRADAKEFVELSTLVERIRDRSSLSIDLKSLRSGWIRVSFITVRRGEDGAAEKVLFAVQDINAEKKTELDAKIALQDAYDAANRANYAKTNFLLSMSHDIRTPMNAIIGMTTIAETHLDDKERVSDCLAKINVSGKHLLGLINEVLDMNKIESGRLDLNSEEFNLSELVDNLLTMSKPIIEERKHHFTVGICGVEHERVIGDSQRIQQVFMNLMSNAVKYTPIGGNIRLTITEKPTNRPTIGCYEFVFEDNGIGMSEEFQKHIFEPFSRAEDSRVTEMRGTGLGMAITKNIVGMMNGSIKVESELNKGSKFTVTVFLELQNYEESVKDKDLEGLSVLVVDDEQIICEGACDMLGELGMEGEWVLKGKEAVDLVEKRHTDNSDYFAVIVDWKMPEMDGVAVTREIRRRVGSKVPIIIISSYDWSDIELEARAAGTNAFISKPLFKSRMAHLFKELLGKESKPANIAPAEELKQKRFKGKRALLVEDNELNAEIAGEILSMVGIEVENAADGKEALDIMAGLTDERYDIIFMDIQMPIMNGYEATMAIRALPGDYVKRVPIIAMTANAFAEDVRESKNAGMNEHIAKPLDFAQLIKALERWLS